ncbi:MAG: hypothetical protein KC478_07500 [Bacteriovoracaceae bacterium]|nr:hypothetical protein [Bacteriovoracaceae bacterium]
MTKKILASLIFSLILSSCQEPAPNTQTQACSMDIEQAMREYDELMNDNDPTNDPEQMPRECNIPDREPSSNLTFKVELQDFNVEQEEKMREALRRAQIVLNSSQFRQRVLNHTYNGEKVFVENDGKSNEEIYYSIMEAAETLMPEIDEEMDLDITLYYRNNSTVGYTYPNTTRIWVNSKFFNTYTLGQVAANAVHEWTHKLGYGHSYNNTPERPYSVPYGVGTIIKELVDGM